MSLFPTVSNIMVTGRLRERYSTRYRIFQEYSTILDEYVLMYGSLPRARADAARDVKFFPKERFGNPVTMQRRAGYQLPAQA